MKQRRVSPDDTTPRGGADDTTPRGGADDTRATQPNPPEDAECCALLRPLPAGRPATAKRRQTSRDAMSRTGRR
jgi:hypothetical protein